MLWNYELDLVEKLESLVKLVNVQETDQFLVIPVPADGEVEIMLRLDPALKHGRLSFRNKHLENKKKPGIHPSSYFQVFYSHPFPGPRALALLGI